MQLDPRKRLEDQLLAAFGEALLVLPAREVEASASAALRVAQANFVAEIYSAWREEQEEGDPRGPMPLEPEG